MLLLRFKLRCGRTLWASEFNKYTISVDFHFHECKQSKNKQVYDKIVATLSFETIGLCTIQGKFIKSD